jgi:hypothetical protein
LAVESSTPPLCKRVLSFSLIVRKELLEAKFQ